MAQGAPTPSYIFRGHASPIHALHFFAANTFLASGDGKGWITIWSVATKRPAAVWQAHEGGIMCLKDWGPHTLISHGRDHKLRVWQLRPEDYKELDTTLPLEHSDTSDSRLPWLLHSLSINALNYCAFSTYESHHSREGTEPHSTRSLLLAASNGLDAGGIDVFQLPSEHRVCKLASDQSLQTGMVMAVALFQHSPSKALTMISGYESGHVLLHINSGDAESKWKWTRVMTTQPHSQPVLSVDVMLNSEFAYSSSADAVIARFDIKSRDLDKKTDTKHAGQQDLKVRDDGRLFATAGWDKRIRVYSAKTLKELAVLKWHQEGCYTTAFADTTPTLSGPSSAQPKTSLVKSPLDLLKDEQIEKAQKVHWLAGGGKDGKISLWDIY